MSTGARVESTVTDAYFAIQMDATTVTSVFYWTGFCAETVNFKVYVGTSAGRQQGTLCGTASTCAENQWNEIECGSQIDGT